MNRCESMKTQDIYITKMIHKRGTALEQSVKYFTGALNGFHGANLTLSSDVNQDTEMFGLHERPLTYPCIISQNI